MSNENWKPRFEISEFNKQTESQRETRNDLMRNKFIQIKNSIKGNNNESNNSNGK